mgnify:CR=1 FL=1
MKLKLTRPLVFFDLETTGLNIASDRIVELSYYKVIIVNFIETNINIAVDIILKVEKSLLKYIKNILTY